MKKLIYKTAIMALSVTIIGAALVYVGSEQRLHKTYNIEVAQFTGESKMPLEEAVRRGKSFMCIGCHQVGGNVLFTAPLVGTLVAPNISRIAPNYTDGELERLIRHGVKKDGTGVLIMPSATLSHLADEDVANVITWLRSLPEAADTLPSKSSFGPLGRVALALDKLPFEADHTPVELPKLVSRPDDLGHYLVQNTCSHCHQMQTESEVDGNITPPLATIAQAYSLTDFTTLLKTGKGVGDRELGLMSIVSQADFSNFSDDEIASIHAYLQTNPQDIVTNQH